MKDFRIAFSWYFPVRESLYKEDEGALWKLEAADGQGIWACAGDRDEALDILRCLILRHQADLFDVYGPSSRPSLGSSPCTSGLDNIYFGWSLPMVVTEGERDGRPSVVLEPPSFLGFRTEGPTLEAAANLMLVRVLRHLSDLYKSGERPPAEVLADPGIYLRPDADARALPDPWLPEEAEPEVCERRVALLWSVPVEVSTSDGYELRGRVDLGGGESISAEGRGLEQAGACRAFLSSLLLGVASRMEAAGGPVESLVHPGTPAQLVVRFGWRFFLRLTNFGGRWEGEAEGFPGARAEGLTEGEVRHNLLVKLLRELAAMAAEDRIPRALLDEPAVCTPVDPFGS